VSALLQIVSAMLLEQLQKNLGARISAQIVELGLLCGNSDDLAERCSKEHTLQA
jgi:hypothetical protein